MRRLLVVLLVALAFTAAGGAAGLQPNDPAWQDQWVQRLIRLPEVWEITTGDPSIVIATVDTGVNPLPDFESALVPGWDFVENDAQPQDTQGHGTRVASVIVSRGNNGIGMAGYCWQCRLMPVRVSGNGSANPDRIAAGIVWAVDHGARIVNVSLTRPGLPDGTEQAAVKYAIDRGVLVVASAGNAGNEALQYPAAYPGVISVGATDDSDSLYFWSTRGSWVTLTAPGCHMVLDVAIGPGTICGTSFTPAAVAGVAGLLLSRNPGLTVYQLATALVAGTKRVPGVASGRIDAYASLASLGLVPTKPPPRATTTATPAPGQRYTRQARIESGTFRRGLQVPLRVGRGRLELQLVTPRASECAATLRSGGEVRLAAPAVKNLLSLSAVVPTGRYVLAVRCTGSRERSYTLGIIAMFPREAAQ